MKQNITDSGGFTSTVDMIEQDLHRRSRMDWWYRLFAPPEPESTASFRQREAYRRGKLISLALLMQLVIVIILLCTVAVFVNRALLPNLAIMVVLLIIAAFCNRYGLVILAGILAVAGLDISLMYDVSTYPAMSSFLLPMLDLLALPELFAVSLLPPVAVFIDAAIHVCFIVATLTFLFPQSRELHALLQSSSFQDALARPIVIQIAVALITYLWVRSARDAIRRADRATSIALLEREMAEQGVKITEEKLRLDASIQEIVSIHARVAKGDVSARVPLMQGNVLWDVAVSLNNLLNRLQRYQHDSLILSRTNEALERFLRARSRAHNNAVPWQKTNTLVDALVQQHNALSQPDQMTPSGPGNPIQ